MNQSEINRYFSLLRMSLRIASDVFLAYRKDLIFSIGSAVLYLTTYLLFLGYLLSRVHAIVGWDIYQMAILTGFGQLWIMFYYAFLTKNSKRFMNDLLSGTFDFSLLKPVNTTFYLFTREIDFTSIILLIESLLLIGYGCMQLHYIPSFIAVLGTLITYAIICHITLNIQTMINCLYILFPQKSTFYYLLGDFFQLGTFPYEVYPKSIFLLLTYIVPIVLFINFPARIFLQILNPWLFFSIFLVEAISIVLSRQCWQAALRRYSSVGG